MEMWQGTRANLHLLRHQLYVDVPRGFEWEEVCEGVKNGRLN